MLPLSEIAAASISLNLLMAKGAHIVILQENVRHFKDKLGNIIRIHRGHDRKTVKAIKNSAIWAAKLAAHNSPKGK